MDETNKWLESVRLRSTLLSESYRYQLTQRLWWANLAFVVCRPFCQRPPPLWERSNRKSSCLFPASPKAIAIPAVSILAGVAAVLTAVHKALKCEEYQAEFAGSPTPTRVWPWPLGQLFRDHQPSATNSKSGSPGEIEDLAEKSTAELSPKLIRKMEKKLRIRLNDLPIEGAVAVPS